MMLLRVLELCLTLVAVAFTWKEVLSPMLGNKPLFPMFRNGALTRDAPAAPKSKHNKTT